MILGLMIWWSHFYFLGKAGEFIDAGDNTYGGKHVVNPSGGLISKGHPLGATGRYLEDEPGLAIGSKALHLKTLLQMSLIAYINFPFPHLITSINHWLYLLHVLSNFTLFLINLNAETNTVLKMMLQSNFGRNQLVTENICLEWIPRHETW